MTMRQRMLAVLKGEEHDRVPFCTYGGMEGLPFGEVKAVLGEGRWGQLRYAPIYRVHYPHCHFSSEDYRGGGTIEQSNTIHEAIGLKFPGPPPDGQTADPRGRWQRNTIHTPAGELREMRLYEPTYNSSSVRKHFVETPEDYEVLWALLEDAVIEPNYERYFYEDALAGDDGIGMAWIERTPWQQMWIEWVGLDRLPIHVADCPEHVAHTVELLQRRERRLFEIAARSPAPFVEMPDNTPPPAIGLRRFRQYCVPLYDELAGMLAERGALVFVHMDGELRGLWDAIAASRVGGLDSFTPAPDTHTSMAEAVAHCPNLRWWVNYPASRHLLSADEIRATAEEILRAAGHSGRLQIQITENIADGTWRTSLPIIAEAIEAFGAP
jgi:hypothetical protein